MESNSCFFFFRGSSILAPEFVLEFLHKFTPDVGLEKDIAGDADAEDEAQK